MINKEITSSQMSYVSGDVISYSIQIVNSGTLITGTQVEVYSRIPVGMTLSGHTTPAVFSGPVLSGGNLYWTIDPFLPGTSHTLAYSLLV